MVGLEQRWLFNMGRNSMVCHKLIVSIIYGLLIITYAKPSSNDHNCPIIIQWSQLLHHHLSSKLSHHHPIIRFAPSSSSNPHSCFIIINTSKFLSHHPITSIVLYNCNNENLLSARSSQNCLFFASSILSLLWNCDVLFNTLTFHRIK